MVNKQPEALRLAEELDAYHTRPQHRLAAEELRRLHGINQELLEALQAIIGHEAHLLNQWRVEAARAAIAKATGGGL